MNKYVYRQHPLSSSIHLVKIHKANSLIKFFLSVWLIFKDTYLETVRNSKGYSNVPDSYQHKSRCKRVTSTKGSKVLSQHSGVG